MIACSCLCFHIWFFFVHTSCTQGLFLFLCSRLTFVVMKIRPNFSCIKNLLYSLHYFWPDKGSFKVKYHQQDNHEYSQCVLLSSVLWKYYSPMSLLFSMCLTITISLFWNSRPDDDKGIDFICYCFSLTMICKNAWHIVATNVCY